MSTNPKVSLITEGPPVLTADAAIALAQVVRILAARRAGSVSELPTASTISTSGSDGTTSALDSQRRAAS